MDEMMIGRGRDAVEMIVDPGSFEENCIDGFGVDPELGPGAVVGTASLAGERVTVLANDAQAMNPRFPSVYFGVIGMEEAYKMAAAVYRTMQCDVDKPVGEKRPLLLIVDTPGNAPGKVEEIIGMNKATGAYQLALAEARKRGHAVIAMVIGRAISGAFLCHGLQADHILALSRKYGTLIHVMPLSSISRITKMDIESLEELSKESPVFASGVEFFYRLGGVEEIVESPEAMRDAVIRHVESVRRDKKAGRSGSLGPCGRGALGMERGGRTGRAEALRRMEEEFSAVASQYLM